MNEQIDTVIDLMIEQSRIFSAQDIAIYLHRDGVDNYILEALSYRCYRKNLLHLDGEGYLVDRQPHFLSADAVKRWWIKSTLRWAATDITHVTSKQLAGAMSISFANERWTSPPSQLLDIGRQWTMVANGSVADTFVFPWVSLLQRFPDMRTLLQARLHSGSELPWHGSSLVDMTKEALNSLQSREAEVLEIRFGLKDGKHRTLGEVGSVFGVTRERIRQIEFKAMRKLRHPARNRYFWIGLASDFLRSGGSLLVYESQKTPSQSLWCRVFGCDLESIDQLGIRIITKFDISGYRATLCDENYRARSDVNRLDALLPFLSKIDAQKLRTLEDEFWSHRKARRWSRPQMLQEALRTLGRAAHYQELSELCNQQFPENQTSTHSWHSALNLPSSEALGIVWIGRKGMYGLKEHGYSRPEMDLFETVTHIVEETFERTQQPVSEEVVVSELNKYRREAKLGSVKMALSFNDKIENVAPTSYVPKGAKAAEISSPRKPSYDIAAAFRAFSEPVDKDI